MKLVRAVDERSKNEPPTDPFGITEQMLERIESM